MVTELDKLIHICELRMAAENNFLSMAFNVYWILFSRFYFMKSLNVLRTMVYFDSEDMLMATYFLLIFSFTSRNTKWTT